MEADHAHIHDYNTQNGCKGLKGVERGILELKMRTGTQDENWKQNKSSVQKF
jgi:hypothetical protein